MSQGSCRNRLNKKEVKEMGEESEYEIRKIDLKDKAKITRVATRKAGEIFKNTKTPDQLLIEIYANVDGWEGRIGTIPKPSSRYVSPKSKMAKFLEKYRKSPEVGMSVGAATNDKGFWTLVL
jgi:hypothetical protein